MLDCTGQDRDRIIDECGEKNAPTMVLCLALLRLAPTCIISPHSKLCAAGRQAGTSAELEKEEGGPITVLVLGGVGSRGALLRLSVQHESRVFRDQKGYNQKV